MTVNWIALGVTIGALGSGAGVALFCGKGIVFFTNLNNAVKTFTALALRVEQKVEDAERLTRQFAEDVRSCLSNHDARLEKLEYVIDLDDHAQSVVRETMRQRGHAERRGRLRRSQDQVNQDVRDMLHEAPDPKPETSP